MSKKYYFRDINGNPYPEVKKALLSDFASKITTKNLDFSVKNVISNSSKRGLISQKDYFDKQIANDKTINSYYIIEKGDFVYNPRISSDSPYGPVNIYKLSDKGIVSPLYLCFSTTGINLDYLEWFFKSDSWYRHVYLNGDTGARHDRVSIKDSNFLSMPISIPSLAEQEKIAEFFSALDERIALTAEKVKLLKEQKQGYLQKVFTRELVFTDENGDQYPEWEEKKLGDLAKKNLLKNKDFAVKNVVSNSSRYGLVPQIDFFDKKIANDKNIDGYYVVEENDFVYNPRVSNDSPYGPVK